MHWGPHPRTASASNDFGRIVYFGGYRLLLRVRMQVPLWPSCYIVLVQKVPADRLSLYDILTFVCLQAMSHYDVGVGTPIYKSKGPIFEQIDIFNELSSREQ